MRELDFKVESVSALGAGERTLSVALSVASILSELRVESISLTVQVQIEPARRRYTDDERRALADLFGEPERWSTTVRPLFWTIINVAVPAFVGGTRSELLLPCPKESDIAAAKYLRALQSDDIPASLLFSGRVFHWKNGVVQMAPIPWSKECLFRIPLRVYEEAMAARERVTAGGAIWM